LAGSREDRNEEVRKQVLAKEDKKHPSGHVYCADSNCKCYDTESKEGTVQLFESHDDGVHVHGEV
jgi:hypothetical protein